MEVPRRRPSKALRRAARESGKGPFQGHSRRSRKLGDRCAIVAIMKKPVMSSVVHMATKRSDNEGEETSTRRSCHPTQNHSSRLTSANQAKAQLQHFPPPESPHSLPRGSAKDALSALKGCRLATGLGNFSGPLGQKGSTLDLLRCVCCVGRSALKQTR